MRIFANHRPRKPHGKAKAIEDALYIHNLCVLTALDEEQPGIDPELDQKFWEELYQDKLGQGDIDAAIVFFNMSQRAGR